MNVIQIDEYRQHDHFRSTRRNQGSARQQLNRADEPAMRQASEIRYVAATGALGVGVDAESLERSLEIAPAFIAADAGTTDAGPFSLGMGVAAFAREAVKRDLTVILSAARRAKIPVLIGSAGTAGGDPHVDWMVDIAREVVRELGIDLRTAVIRSEQSKDYLLGLHRQGRIRALDPAPELSEHTNARSTRIGGMMGVEPLQAALEAGAEFVLSGRWAGSPPFAGPSHPGRVSPPAPCPP